MNDWLPGRKYEQKNRYRYVNDDIIEVQLTAGTTTLIDIEDIDILDDICWHMSPKKTGNYVQGSDRYSKKQICMSRLIMERIISEEQGEEYKLYTNEFVQHLNEDKLDNRRSNLDISNTGLNNIRGRVAHNNKTGFKGIVHRKNRNSYCAYFTHHGVKRSRSFSINNYGAQRALQLAIQWREQQERSVL